MRALLNLFVESAANDQATYIEWNNMSVANRTATSEQSWRRKESTPRRKQSTQAKQSTARNKNALARVTLQENKITPNRTVIKLRQRVLMPEEQRYSVCMLSYTNAIPTRFGAIVLCWKVFNPNEIDNTNHKTVIRIFLFFRNFKEVQLPDQPCNINMGYDVNEDKVIS